MSSVDPSDLRARREAVVSAHIEAEAVQHDVAAVVATFKRPRYEVPGLGGVMDGAAAVDGLIHNLLGAFPDFWLKERGRHHADNAVIVECVFGGTQEGVFAGIAPTGRKMEVAAALVFEFEEDGLVCERVYFDFATVLRQLGVIV
jgi:SnoaL-like polyketide cyclase